MIVYVVTLDPTEMQHKGTMTYTVNAQNEERAREIVCRICRYAFRPTPKTLFVKEAV